MDDSGFPWRPLALPLRPAGSVVSRDHRSEMTPLMFRNQRIALRHVRNVNQLYVGMELFVHGLDHLVGEDGVPGVRRVDGIERKDAAEKREGQLLAGNFV